MLRKFRVAYFAHSLRSDWNNGNAHFLRGLLRNLGQLGHVVRIFELESDWSIDNLRTEEKGEQSLEQFGNVYPDLTVQTYAQDLSEGDLAESLSDVDIVVLHEWNPTALAHTLLKLRESLKFKLIFHDTHHRASSSPESIAQFGIDRFDGVFAFGESLRNIYAESFGISRVWTVHEAADISVFKPLPGVRKSDDVVWIGNWGDGERSKEISQFLLEPATALQDHRFSVYGVRYPSDGVEALQRAGVRYHGYLPNLSAPSVYSAARLTVHIPRQQYAAAMTGIPTIRVFEALACGIPLISAPWADTENLFREGDYMSVRNAQEMRRAMEFLLSDPEAAEQQALHGLETVLARHTCRHRAEQLVTIFEESLS